MNPTRVFILASQTLFAQGVQSLISGQPGIEVVGIATADPGALAQVQAADPDVVIVEAAAEGQKQLIAQILGTVAKAKVIDLTLQENRIRTYYQESKQGGSVEDLLDAIQAPAEWHSRSPETLRLFVLFQGHYGQRILENLRHFAPKTWKVDAWRAPHALPQVVDDPTAFLPPHLPPVDLVLSLGENPSVAQLLPTVVERTGAQAVIAPVDNVDWLPDGLASQLGAQLTQSSVTAVFPKPFCSLTEGSYNVPQHKVSYEDPWIGEFARYFGSPAFEIECNSQVLTSVQVKRDTACGCARDIARQLPGVSIEEAVIQAGLLHHHYPCLATMRVDPGLGEPLIQAAGDFARQAVKAEISRAIKK